MGEYLRKRDAKAGRKSSHKKLLKEGRDDDSYLSDAFEWKIVSESVRSEGEDQRE